MVDEVPHGGEPHEPRATSGGGEAREPGCSAGGLGSGAVRRDGRTPFGHGASGVVLGGRSQGSSTAGPRIPSTVEAESPDVEEPLASRARAARNQIEEHGAPAVALVVATGDRRDEVHFVDDQDHVARVSHLVRPTAPLPPQEHSAVAAAADPHWTDIADVAVAPDSPSVWDARPTSDRTESDEPGRPAEVLAEGFMTVARPLPGGATSAQLKGDIECGRTGDKVEGFDPAAAPLGTDDEAGGASYDPRLVEQARLDERKGRSPDPRPHASTPELQPNGRLPSRNYLLAVAVGVVSALAFAALLAGALA